MRSVGSRGTGGLLASLVLLGSIVSGCALGVQGSAPVIAPGPSPVEPSPISIAAARTQALDAIFDDPQFARAMFGVRVESLTSNQVLYTRNSEKLVVPASNMKLLTMSVAAEKLGWDFTFKTRLVASGARNDGTLTGDLVVVGGGDPSIGSNNFDPSPLFAEWADALVAAGIRRVDGRLIGNDNVFDDTIFGPGWAWDYLGDGYAAGSSGLSYNENVAIIRIWPGATVGAPARVELSPAGHGLVLMSEVTTVATGGTTSISQSRRPGSDALMLRGTIAADRPLVVRTAAVANPTKFFVEAFRSALEERGIFVRGGAFDIDDIDEVAFSDLSPTNATRSEVIAEHQSLPLSSLGAYFLKESQNFYGETLLKTLGRRVGDDGSTEAGRTVAAEQLTAWGIPPDAYVMYDGSGLSRYNYVSADAIVMLLKHVWADEKLRGPFLAALPVGGQDGTLGSRMRDTVLAGHVQAKTGTISNVRSLSGFLVTQSGERLVFSMIANHFTATSRQVDAVVEKALAWLATEMPAR